MTPLFMIVDNLDIDGIFFFPFEANPILIIYPDTVLSFSLTREFFE